MALLARCQEAVESLAVSPNLLKMHLGDDDFGNATFFATIFEPAGARHLGVSGCRHAAKLGARLLATMGEAGLAKVLACACNVQELGSWVAPPSKVGRHHFSAEAQCK